jgi:serine/threonine-protein kinase
VPADGGIRFGQYLLLRRIARGGMAEVFLAQQRGLEGFDRRVAVKRILPHLLDSPDFVRMFLGEAKLAAQLTHPNVVHIYDFGKVENDYFLAMEYIDGVHAGQVFKLGDRGDKMPPTLVARIGADAASALHYAHDLRGPEGKALGLVHRDVSPANIMISYDGVVKLCDFGIAKAAALSDQLTNPGQVKGKYAYMSPEQTIAAHLDGRSDVFSLAIVLWELLTGKFIVQRGDAVDAMRAIRDGKLEPLIHAAPATPPPLAKAISWALETKREKRATAAQLAEALEGFIKSSPEIGNSMQLAAWIRARFPRDASGPRAAIAPAGGGTAAAHGTSAAPGTAAAPSTMAAPRTMGAPRTMDAPETVIVSDTHDVVAPPPAHSHQKLAGRLAEDHTSSFAGQLAAPGRPARPPPTLQLTESQSEATVLDLSQRAAEETTARDRPTDTEIVDAMATILRDRGSSPPRPTPPPLTPAVMPVVGDSKSGGVVAPATPAAATPPHGRAAPAHGTPATPTPELRRTKRRMRMLLAGAGLTGLALTSFAIALAMSGGSRSHAQLPDATAIPVVVPVPPPHPDAAPVIVAPPPVDASAKTPPSDAAATMGYLEVTTMPAGGTLKVGDQTRTAPAQFMIPAGHVSIIAELAGFADERRQVDLEPGEHHEVEIAFTKKLRDKPDHHGPELGKLTVRTVPYSDVYDGSTLIGTTPFAERVMLAGPHTLVFKNPKHGTIEKKITIVAGKTLKLSFDLP